MIYRHVREWWSDLRLLYHDLPAALKAVLFIVMVMLFLAASAVFEQLSDWL